MLETQTEQDLLRQSDPMEFWPTWKLYLPLIPYIAFESIRSIRSGSISSLGFGTIAAADPGIELGGLVGESKFKILRGLDPQHILKFFLVPKDSKDVHSILEKMNSIGLKFPIILKPDSGQRGQGVRKVKDPKQLEECLLESNVDLLVQEFHPGPFEVGVFYYRYPNETKGKIFSVTRKVFPKLVGNGISTLSQLVENHPRFKIQKETFQKRFSEVWEKIPKLGEIICLSEAGNHCQGTLFLDGSEWITSELENKIDEISTSFSGFYFGRYDIRFSSLKDFLEGKDLHIVELNGVTSESTNIYDPRFSFRERYSILFSQWKILFRISRQSKAKGAGLFSILKALRDFYFGTRIVSDLSI
ncbi:carboxylate--amine ligase [Leptospira hartskeerlii]|uniref:Carboxylate--amine ligase n=1 Tax=Leptospira hartskeerlii TaxID=2023177 RepID=A0A2M9X9L7_9LEPT|nr:carboxylate--amine ligase [Leptospira hartskeerlii]PJZ24354.1 carboxylate--amine ligase [Leptospira hartskeerlii]PJZ32023.1 carboxylate--amine ligase [Leptospira hartskeerlii]